MIKDRIEYYSTSKKLGHLHYQKNLVIELENGLQFFG
jgi:hypothetical protein